ncbi:MAG: ABC transporter ATP-binding protein [Pseudomonadota bacterium]
MSDTEPLLVVDDLKTWFATESGIYKAVDGVSFDVDRGHTLGIVGESGCGKSVTSLSIMGLVPKPPGIAAGGRVRVDGEELTALPAEALRRVRGAKLAMIFQEPMSSLNPVQRVGEQIVEGLVRNRAMARDVARARAIELLGLVRIPAPETRVDAYPHQLSGGMRQRVMIAMALAGDPALLIADEPTTALDVTIQAQILDLLRDLQKRLGMAIVLITHDLGVIAEMADDVVVMYAGKVVERAPVGRLFDDAQHPYTLGLLDSVPKLDDARARLATIEGQVPHPGAELPGCRFAERCVFAEARCRETEPPLRSLAAGHAVACWLAPLDHAKGEAA